MLSKASRLALSGLLLSLFAATPAAAQGDDPEANNAPPSCPTTISQRTGVAREAGQPSAACGAPREMIFHGGRLAHAIILTSRSHGPLPDPTLVAGPDGAWLEFLSRQARPAFARRPVMH